MTFLKWVPGKKHDGILMANVSQASKNLRAKGISTGSCLALEGSETGT
jgi:hypothetical protein